ncbi:hypothetical protein FXO37_11715 [Capsicum annuum]|nr:hypothetical protein FXO37_11715 [Capsicum annuum]
MEQNIVTQLLTCMDESHRVVKPNDAEECALPSDKRNSEAKSDGSNHGPSYVLVIGATNRPDAIDPTLRRPGRFNHEIALGIPDENARAQILSVLTRNLRVEGAFDVMKIASSTPGFVGADLAAITNKEGNLAMKRIIDVRKVELLGELADGEDAKEWWRKPWSPEEMANLSINMADFEINHGFAFICMVKNHLFCSLISVVVGFEFHSLISIINCVTCVLKSPNVYKLHMNHASNRKEASSQLAALPYLEVLYFRCMPVEYPTIVIPRIYGIRLWCLAVKPPIQVAARSWSRYTPIVVLKTPDIDACWKLLGIVVLKLLVHKLVDKNVSQVWNSWCTN